MSESTVLPVVPTLNGVPNSDAKSLDHLDETQLRLLAQSLLQKIAQDSNQIESQALKLKHNQAYIDALTHEIRLLRHLRFARKSEAMDDRQLRLFDEAINEDIAAAEAKLAELTKNQPSTKPRNQLKRQPLPIVTELGCWAHASVQ